MRPPRIFGLSILVVISFLVAACSGDEPDGPDSAPPRTSSTEQAVWTNGDFENDAIGTTPPSGWTLTTNLNPGITDTRPNPQTLASLNLATGGTSFTAVVGGNTESQTDPDLGTNGTLRFPKYGVRATRINATAIATGLNRNVNTLKQTMTATIGDVDTADNKVHIRFAIAPILENPAHTYVSQPYYYVRVQNLTKAITIYSDFNTSGQTGVPWKNFTDASGNAAQYTDWMLVDIAPGDAQLAVGDQVELQVIAAGCSQGGHWGRVYVDAVGSGVPGLFAYASGPQQVNSGSTITYTINYKNGGTTNATTTKLDLVTPPNTTFNSVSLGAACTAPAAGATGTVSCSLGTLPPGATGSYTVTVNVPSGTANGTVITNGNYYIYATGINALIGPKVNTTVTSGVTYADVGVTLTDGVAAIGAGQSTTYTLTATNNGPAAAPTVTITDTMPSQLTNVTWTCSGTGGGICTPSGNGNISDASVQLPVGATVRYLISATVSASATGTVVNTATAAVSGGVTDPDTTNNTAVDSNSIGTLRTLNVTKTGSTQAGTVSSTPAAISCGPSCTTATGQFLDGSQVQLTATPVAGAVFNGWSGACSGTATTCTVTMSANQSVVAQFTGPTISIASGNNQSATVNNLYLFPLSVVVRDGNGNAINGAVVTFTAPTTGPSVTLSSSTATTNIFGQAQVNATANNTAGTFQVTASFPGATPVQFTLTNNGDPTSVTVSSGSPQTTPVTTAFAQPLVALVRDSNNQPVGGVTVTFAVPSTGASATLSSTTAVTDANGLASVTATANTVAGTYNATATVGFLTPANFALTNTPGAAANLSLIAPTARSATVNTTQGTFVVEVTDAFGNLVPGVTVNFAAPTSGASATLSAASAVTGANGRASITALANTVAGSYSIVASATGVTSKSFSVTNNPGAATTMTVTSGNNQSTTIGTAFAAPLVVTLRDTFGNAVPGATVTFTPPASGASATVTTSVTTDSNGQAQTTATANNTAGTYNVVAAATGVTSQNFSLTNTAGAVAAISVVSGGTQSTPVTTAFALPLVVRVADASNNPISGVTVTFTRPTTGASATLSQSTVITGANGQAQVTATANTLTGSYSVTATAPGAASPATFALTNTPGAATTLTLIAPTTRSAVVGTTQGTFTVELTDAQGNLVPGATVTFAAPASGASTTLSATSAVTGANGRASVTGVANGTTGTYSITASATGTTSQSFTVTNTPGSPSTVTVVSGTPQSTTISTAFAAPLVVRVRDSFGNNIPGVSVAFTAPTTGASATVPATVTTDANGLASASATANSTAGTYNVTATVTGLTPVTFALTNTAGTPAAISVVSGGTQSTAVTTAFGAPLVVRVTDAGNNPVSGATVTFTRPATGASATLSSTTVTTGANGQAQVTATANTIAGTYNVTAAVSGVTTPATFALTNTPGAATTLTLIAPTTRSATVNTSQGTFTVEVTDAQGNIVPGVTVNFAAPASGASATLSAASAVTGANGRASITGTANTVAGTYSITASSTGTTSQSFTVTNTPGAAATVTVVSGTPQTTTASTAFAAPLVVRVRDSFGNNVSGVSVAFTAPTTGASATVPATVTTDANGLASAAATANATAGTYNVTATVTGLTPVTFALTNTAGAAASISVVSGGTQSTAVTTAFAQPLVIQVNDAGGNPVSGATVTFTRPGSGASATLSSTTVTTGANGQAQVTATANTIAGSYNVTAAVSGVTTPATFALTNTPGAATTLTLIAPTTRSATVNTSQGSFVVQVSDAQGNVVPGVTVNFAAPASGASATLSAASAVTGANGRATITGTANTVAGTYSITASSTGTTSQSFTVTNTPGAAATVTVVSGTPQSTTVGTAYAAPLVVRVRDSFGNNVSGASVAFTAPTTGASATVTGTVTTDANGLAQTTATANNTAGTYNVTATVTGLTPVTFALTNTAGAPAAISAVSGGSQSTVVGTAFAAPLIVRVTDANGNLVSGATVTFTRPGSGASATLSATTVTTGANGQAQVTATANTVTGTYNVTAAVSGVTTPATFALTNTPGAAATLTIVSGTPQSTTIETAFAPLVVRVRDSFGNNVSGATVSFAAPTTGASATVPTTLTTDANGLASASATANTVAGSYNVTASTSGVTSPVSFALTNNPGAATTIVLIAPTTRSATVGTSLGSFTALVTDSRGNPVPGVNLTYSAPLTGASAALSATTGTTGSDGRATFTATANNVAGNYSITVASLGLPSQTFSITNTPGAPATLALVSGSNQSAAVGTAFAAPLVARVRDSFGNNVAGVAVTFTPPTTGATAIVNPVTATTDNNGLAQTAATAGTVTGTYNVGASATGLSTISYSLTNTPGAPANLVLIAPTSRTATVGTALGTFTAEVTDAFGNPIPGTVVTFSAPLTGASANLSSPTATSGSDGRASITATANNTAGSFSITASVPGLAPQSFSITTTPGAPASFVIVSGSPQSATVDAAFAPLVVRVRDAFGNNISGAPVTFTAPATGATAILGTASTTTDANGLAQTTATAGPIAGSYSVTATTLGLPNVSFALTNTPGAPVAVQVNAGDDQSAEVTDAFASPLSVRVVDSHGNPVPNVTVTFAAPGGTGASATLSATTVTTNSSGLAQVTATANTVTGAYQVNATIAGVSAPAVFDLTNTPGAPATITIVGGDDQSAEIEDTFAQPLRVVVRDAQGNVVPGATVVFTSPATGASAAVDGSVTTDQDGIASSGAVANAIAGAYEVTAAVNGVNLPVVFNLTNTPGAATTIAVSGGDAQETEVDTFFADPFEVLVTDRAGNPVPGVAVHFLAPGTSPSAQLSQTTVVTDATGHASVTGEADFRSGSYVVTASIAADLDVTFNLKNLPGAPAEIIAAPTSTPQSSTVLTEYDEPLVAQVVDRFGNPVPGATVTFTVPTTGASAGLSTRTAITDANGNVSVIATANGTTGTYIVSAAVAGVANSAPFQLTNTAGAPTLVSIESGGTQSTVVDTDFPERLVVKVVDAQGNPVPNAIVSFDASPDPATATLSASSVATDASGLASVSAHASTVSGSHQVTAVVIGAATPVVFDLTNLPDAPERVTADLGSTPQQQGVGRPYLRSLEVHVYDRFGNPVPGTTVTYAAPATGATGVLSATTVTTDGDGDAFVTITAGQQTGNFDVTATVNGVTVPATFDLTNLPGAAHRLIPISGDEQSTVVATVFATQLVLRVVDEFDNPVPGQTVTFAAPTSPATATLAPVSVVTDGQGIARTTATASTVTGVYDVVATSQQGAAPILFELTNTPDVPAHAEAAPGATPQTAEVRRGFGAPLQVIVTDRFGNRVPNVVITYTTVSGPGATLSATSATTAPDGTAEVLAIADAAAGSYQVTARVAGLAEAVTFQLTNTSAAVAYIVIVSGDGQSAMATTSFGLPLVFRVLDNFGNPVPGVALTTAMTQTGPSAAMTTSTNVSDSDGYVRYNLVANGVPGEFGVTATAQGAAGMAVALLHVTAIPTQTAVELPASVSIDQKVRVQIRVTGQIGTPTGTVELFDADGKMIGTAELSGGAAEALVQLPSLGEHAVTVRYPAQSSFGESSSSAGTVMITEDEGSLNGTTSCNAGGGAGGMLPMLFAVAMMIGWRRRRSLQASGAGLALAVLAVVLAGAGTASAEVDESSRAVNRFHAASAESAWFAGDSLEFEGHGGVAVGFTGDYGYRPLVVYNADDNTRTVVVENSLLAHFTASVTLKQKFRISASAPLALYQNGNDGSYNGEMLPAPDFAFTFGDMYLAGDYRVVGGPRSQLRAAVGVRFTLPTGMRTDYMSDSKFAVEPRGMLALSKGRVELAATAGAFLRGASDLATEDFGSELRYTASAGFRLMREQQLLLGPEIIGALPLSGSSDTGYPTEVGAGIHYRTRDQLQLSLGANTGIVNAVGVPEYRVFLGMAWAAR